MCSLTSGTYLFHLFSFFACIPLLLAHTQSIISPSLACIPLPLAHTYFTFFLFPHVFLCSWHIPISSFLFFRMYSFASGTYPIHNFTLSRMYSLTSGTYLFHLFSFSACIPLLLAHTYFIFFVFPHVFLCFWHIPISPFFFFRMYSFASVTYLFHLFSFSACILLPLTHTYFIFFLFSHVFLCLWHISNP